VGVLRQAARGLSPAYFALVMATGIVSVDAHLLDLPRVATALPPLNIAAYLVIWALTALRVVWFPRDWWRDMVEHRSGPGFFTSVAASGVLGSQFVLLANDYGIAKILWFMARPS
jgi:tellurite resistance protein TehA-like permease